MRSYSKMPNRLRTALPLALVGSAISAGVLYPPDQIAANKPQTATLSVHNQFVRRDVFEAYQKGSLTWKVTDRRIGSIAIREADTTTTVSDIRCQNNGSVIGKYSVHLANPFVGFDSDSTMPKDVTYQANKVALIGLCNADGTVSQDVDPSKVGNIVQSQ